MFSRCSLDGPRMIAGFFLGDHFKWKIHRNSIFLNYLMTSATECDISSRDFSVSRLFSIFWEYRSRSRKFWSRKKVSVSVSKIFSLEKKSRYRSRKFLVSKKVSVSVSKIFGLEKSLGLGLENFGLEKKSRYWSRWNFLVSSLSDKQTFPQICSCPPSDCDHGYEERIFW